MKKLMAGLAAAGVLALAGCSSESTWSTRVTAASPATSTSFSCAEWDMTNKSNPQVLTALQAAKVPLTVKLGSVVTESNTDDTSTMNVLAYVCGAGVQGDDLKDVATTLARALKASPVGNDIAQMRVSNVSDRDNPLMRVRCEDFQLYTWAPDTEPAIARTSWKTSNEN